MADSGMSENDVNVSDGETTVLADDTKKMRHQKGKKKKTPGIVYLSYIPPKLNVKMVRQMLSAYGEIGRIFLQPEKPNGRCRTFTEGWVEFADKKVAKLVAHALNNKQVGGKRRAEYYHSLWSLKYLHRFRWTHLNERLAYEKAVREQRLRTEIAQAKRESNFYVSSVEKSKRLKKTGTEGDVTGAKVNDVRQRATNEEILEEQRKKKGLQTVDSVPDIGLLKNIFIRRRKESTSMDFESE
ncbi:activator of basal transcription 1-like [Ornithodoros turicata]